MHVHSSHKLFLKRKVLWVLLRTKEHGLGQLVVHGTWVNYGVLLVSVLGHPVHLLLVELMNLLKDPFNVKHLGLV
jgi:hypothetical protein